MSRRPRTAAAVKVTTTMDGDFSADTHINPSSQHVPSSSSQYPPVQHSSITTNARDTDGNNLTDEQSGVEKGDEAGANKIVP